MTTISEGYDELIKRHHMKKLVKCEVDECKHNDNRICDVETLHVLTNRRCGDYEIKARTS